MAGFPGVGGVLDCVQVYIIKYINCIIISLYSRQLIGLSPSVLHLQVAIKAPNSEDSTYVNKKGFHSVACQLVCDARGLLLSAETNWPGGLNDAEVLERSALGKQLQDTENWWLLGETGIFRLPTSICLKIHLRCLLFKGREEVKCFLFPR